VKVYPGRAPVRFKHLRRSRVQPVRRFALGLPKRARARTILKGVDGISIKRMHLTIGVGIGMPIPTGCIRPETQAHHRIQQNTDYQKLKQSRFRRRQKTKFGTDD
jgi:hypothetical protein